MYMYLTAYTVEHNSKRVQAKVKQFRQKYMYIVYRQCLQFVSLFSDHES